jgi:CobQ-like glutamine amidotransferase family enzyme
MSETASDVLEALNKARQMCVPGLANVSIEDQAGHKIDGDELLDCITKKDAHRRLTGSLGS